MKCRLQNFKAVRDTGEITLTPLTVFIGNNGSGKSSIIEGLEAMKAVIRTGLDDAFIPWKGFESVWNRAVSHRFAENQLGRLEPANPVSFEVSGALDEISFTGAIEVNTDKKGNRLFITKQDFTTPLDPPPNRKIKAEGPQDRIHDGVWREFVRNWQFLNLEPSRMLEPQPQRRSPHEIRLAKDGSNIAQFLQSIADLDPQVLEGIIETVQTILPYVEDFRPAITSELERNVYLKLTEKGIKEPLGSWLLSQGTLRIVALLAVFRHPRPPSVVFIEELENGLDPRTIHVLIDEIRSFIESGGQVVATTHSPYLLDLLDLSHLIVVERSASGASTFIRPSKEKLKGWAKDFAPGKLYTMGNLTRD